MTGTRSVAADLRRSRAKVRKWYNDATVQLAEKMHMAGKHDDPAEWVRTCPICLTFITRKARMQ